MHTWREEFIPFKTLTSGEVLHLHLYTITSAHPGPQVYLQSSMHAAEIQGQGVLWHLLQYLSNLDFNGQIQIITAANPMVANQKMLTHTMGRYNLLTGNNWNRNYLDFQEHLHFDFAQFAQAHQKQNLVEITQSFKQAAHHALQEFLKNPYGLSDEQRLAVTLQSYASQADIVIDLHNAWAGTHYLYATEDDANAPSWGIPFIIRMPYLFAGALDEASFMPWFYLAQALRVLGKDIKFDFASYTVELASEECFSFAQSKQDLFFLLNYLAARGIVDKHDVEKEKEKENINDKEGKKEFQNTPTTVGESDLANFKTYFAPRSGLVDYLIKPGTLVKAGAVLAQYLTWPTVENGQPQLPQNTSDQIVALKDAVILNHANSSLVHEGQSIIQVLENVRQAK